jgi:hypothetical protein
MRVAPLDRSQFVAFRFLNPAPVFFETDGTTLCALGTLETYSDEACTTPYATFNSPDLDVPNPVEISLGSDGRASVEIWSGVSFFARLLDSDDNTVWTREITSGIPAGLTLPVLEEGEFLTGDGVDYLALALDLLPDPAGSAGYLVRVNGDGTGYELTEPAQIVIPDSEIDVDFPDNYVQLGNYRKQFGTGTVASASGAQKNSVNITFPVAFDSAPVEICVWNTTPGGSSTYGRVAGLAVSSVTAAGMTVTADVSEDDTQSQHKLNNATTFGWCVGGEYDPS